MEKNITADELRYTNWKVYIDNTSEWFDIINKRLAKCYTDTKLIKFIYPEIRAFADSRSANLRNYDEINFLLSKIENIIYRDEYNLMENTSQMGVWNQKILKTFSKIIRLLAFGMSNSELIPKYKKIYDPSKAVAEIE